MLALYLERLFLFDIGDVTVAVMVGIMKFRKRIVMWRHFHPRVINLDLFERFDIVVNDHPFGSNDCHIPDLPWIQPTALDRGKPVLAEIDAHRGDIFNSRSNVGIAPAVNPLGQFFHNIQHDRDVMRSKVPRHVDVLLKEPQIQPPRTDILNVSDVAPMDDFFDLSNGRRVKERMADHQNQVVLFRQLNQFLALRRRRGHGFLDKCMLACQQAGFRHLVVRLHRCSDNDRVQPGPVEHMFVVHQAFNIGIEGLHML